MTARPQPPRPSARDFADIRAVFNQFPAPDDAAKAEAESYAAKTALPPFPAEILSWMAAAQGRFPPQLQRPRIVVFASDHGAAQGVSKTKAAVAALLDGSAPLGGLAEENNADLRLYELNLDQPTADFTKGPAMDEAEGVNAILYGMMAVDAGIDALFLTGMGHGAGMAAGVLARLLGHENLAAALGADKVALHEGVTDPLDLLRRVGGREMAAMLGVMIAARMARAPVVIEGLGALVTAALLHRISGPLAVTHCFYVNNGAPEEAKRLAAELGILQAETESKSKTGVPCASMVPLLRAAASVR